MKVLLTGAGGFLGWHTRCRLHALTDHEVVAVTRDNWDSLPQLASDVDAIIHVAGVNRAEPDELSEGNAKLAHDVAEAARSAAKPPVVVFANSIQAGNETPYGDGKAAAAEVLRTACAETGSVFVDVRLPNLFGEHCRPQYNSFVANFVDWRIKDEPPTINDRPINLLHVQDAAQALMDGLAATESTVTEPEGHPTSVQGVWDLLCTFHELYPVRGEIPPFTCDFDVALFNTYRAALFPDHYPIRLDPKSDPRGRLVETIRSHGGQGQSFVSTTVPDITRGDHYHLVKIERFAVLSGTARIALRKMFTEELVEFEVSGDEPVAIDMPTMWTHNITNTGDTEVLTQFWTHVLFDPENPDTFWVKVDSKECSQ
ncbi:polysaccharide biosynthesis C-terminal domain-containing protein [Mariniluteicoccus flavus]